MNVMMSGLRLPTINYSPDDPPGGGDGPPPADNTPPIGDPPASDTPAADAPADAPKGDESPWGDIDDELKEFAGDKKPADVLKELKGAQHLLGKKQIGIPDESSTPEEWAAFHENRGVPKEPDGYDFTSVRDELLKDIPEDQRKELWDEGEETRFKEFARASNISQTEAKNLLDRELKYRMETGKAAAAESAKIGKAAQDLITEKWGNNTDTFTQDANNFARHMGLGDDVMAAIQKLSATSAEARFKLVDYMRQQGATLREGGQPGKTAGGALPAATMTKDQARMAKEEYLSQSDNRKAYLDSGHKNHKAVTDQVTEYLKVERGV